MYAFLYFIFYLFSLLPWFILYLVSDGIYILVYYVFGYRKKVVLNNLQIAFPEKTEKERIRIAKDFYHNFIDNFIETLKLISISEKEMLRRFKTNNINVLNDLYDKVDKVQIITGHYFNWEFANLSVGIESKFPFLVVYMPLKNKSFNKLIYTIRTKFKTVLISATNYRNEFKKYSSGKYSLILVSDQNPGNPENAYWGNFFGKKTPLVKGPEKGSKQNNTAVIYADFYKIKRGFYQLDFELISINPREDFKKEGTLTKLLLHKIEESIKQHPANYLWSHKKWKHEFDEKKHGHLIID